MKYTKQTGRPFSWEGLQGVAYIESNDSQNITAASIETTASHGKIRNTRSTILYYVVSGEGEFFVDSWFAVSKDDVILIEPNTPYDFRATKGILKLFVVHTPGYRPQDDESKAVE